MWNSLDGDFQHKNFVLKLIGCNKWLDFVSVDLISDLAVD